MFKIKKMNFSYLVGAIALSVVSMSSSATVIDLNYDQSEFASSDGQKALAGFQSAASFWSDLFTDDISVSIDIGFSSLGGDILGQTTSTMSNYLYQDVRTAMMKDQTSSVDSTVVENLPCDSQGNGLCYMEFIDIESGVTVIDNDGSKDNSGMNLTQANAKALGFITAANNAAFSAVDGIIKFSSDFSFDFDGSDGIDSNKIDFVGVAIHEIGHALGFVSGVDTYDYYINELDSSVNLDKYNIASVLDLFRYSSESLSYGDNVLDYRAGGSSYFSIDGGLTSLGSFATGVYGGDGSQASHWKDNAGLGVMDPTFSYGEGYVMSTLDLTAFDAIGWDLASSSTIGGTTSVPLPSTASIFGLAFAGLFSSRRKLKVES